MKGLKECYPYIIILLEVDQRDSGGVSRVTERLWGFLNKVFTLKVQWGPLLVYLGKSL